MSSTASIEELKAVIRETLENRGILGHVKAQIRAEVFNSIDDQSDSRPTLSNENLIINDLIREYLQFNKYNYTASVLLSEAGQPAIPLSTSFLAKSLNVATDGDDSTSIPLLYRLVEHYKNTSVASGSRVSSNIEHQTRPTVHQDTFMEMEHAPTTVVHGRTADNQSQYFLR